MARVILMVCLIVHGLVVPMHSIQFSHYSKYVSVPSMQLSLLYSVFTILG